jgi:hypothetical protein
MNLVRSLTACVALASIQGWAQAQATLPESPGALEYRTVSDALGVLKSKPGVSITETKPDGWIIASEAESVVWSFTPTGHYAHPAVVRREVVVRDGNVAVETRALCQAEKAACDMLIREFQELNERMRQSIQHRMGARR